MIYQWLATVDHEKNSLGDKVTCLASKTIGAMNFSEFVA